jgi:hypothetical protein
MPPPQEGKICLAPRAALLLWIAAQVMSASTLLGQSKAPSPVWKPAIEDRSIGDQPARAFAPAAAVETLSSTLLIGAAKPDSPIELWSDARQCAVHLRTCRQRDPLRGVEPPTWVIVGAATLLLATTNTRHHRRRAHTGCRHAVEPAATKRKPHPTPWAGESAALGPLVIPKTAH